MHFFELIQWGLKRIHEAAWLWNFSQVAEDCVILLVKHENQQNWSYGVRFEAHPIKDFLQISSSIVCLCSVWLWYTSAGKISWPPLPTAAFYCWGIRLKSNKRNFWIKSALLWTTSQFSFIWHNHWMHHLPTYRCTSVEGLIVRRMRQWVIL